MRPHRCVYEAPTPLSRRSHTAIVPLSRRTDAAPAPLPHQSHAARRRESTDAAPTPHWRHSRATPAPHSCCSRATFAPTPFPQSYHAALTLLPRRSLAALMPPLLRLNAVSHFNMLLPVPQHCRIGAALTPLSRRIDAAPVSLSHRTRCSHSTRWGFTLQNCGDTKRDLEKLLPVVGRKCRGMKKVQGYEESSWSIQKSRERGEESLGPGGMEKKGWLEVVREKRTLHMLRSPKRRRHVVLRAGRAATINSSQLLLGWRASSSGWLDGIWWGFA